MLKKVSPTILLENDLFLWYIFLLDILPINLQHFFLNNLEASGFMFSKQKNYLTVKPKEKSRLHVGPKEVRTLLLINFPFDSTRYKIKIWLFFPWK